MTWTDQGHPTKILKTATTKAQTLSAFCMIGTASTTVHMLTSLSSKREPQELGTAIIPHSSGETEVR